MQWYKVKVYFPAEHGLPAFTHEDEIKDNSLEHALERAYWNWDKAERIELV